jgi:hypothetical protein
VREIAAQPGHGVGKEDAATDPRVFCSCGYLIRAVQALDRLIWLVALEPAASRSGEKMSRPQ